VKHLTFEQLSARLDGALAGAAAERADAHLAECASCRAELAALAAREASLKPVLKHDPGDAYFETFAARVEDRIRAAGLAGAQSRLGGNGVFAWLRSPRRLAWVGGAMAIIAGAAIVLLTPHAPTQLENTALRERMEQKAPAPGSGTLAPPVADEELSSQATPEARQQAALRTDDARTQPDKDERTTASKRAAERDVVGQTQEVQPFRLREVRRTPAGEEVVVPDPKVEPFATPPPAAPAPAEGQGVRVRKPGAQPMSPSPAAPSRESANLAPERAEMAKLSQGPETQLCGQVLDTAGRPVSGAQVVLAERGRVASTDASGRFCVTAPAGNYELAVMAVGYSETRQQVRVAGETAEARITLKPVNVLEPPLRALADRAKEEAAHQARGGRPSESQFRIMGDAAIGKDVFAGLTAPVRALVRDAQTATSQAEARRSAPRYDAAAGKWERALSRIEPGPAEVEARFQLATARYQSWRLAPTTARTRAASATIAAFLAIAPEGPQRENALRWREAVKP
jgi:hypothetical protein